MPDTIKSLKIENDSLKSEVASLKVALKNLEASIERRLIPKQANKMAVVCLNPTKKRQEVLIILVQVMTSYRASEWRPKLILNAWINDFIV